MHNKWNTIYKDGPVGGDLATCKSDRSEATNALDGRLISNISIS